MSEAVNRAMSMVYQSRTFRKDLHARLWMLAALRHQRTGRRQTVEALLNEVVEVGLRYLEPKERQERQ